MKVIIEAGSEVLKFQIPNSCFVILDSRFIPKGEKGTKIPISLNEKEDLYNKKEPIASV